MDPNETSNQAKIDQKVVVAKSKPLKSAGNTFVTDNLDRRISVAQLDGTQIVLLSVFGIHYNTDANRWEPHHHVGILCSGNQFDINTADGERSYDLCLLHALPAQGDERLTEITVCFADNKYDLYRIMAQYVGTNHGWQVDEEPLGKTFVPLSKLAELSRTINEKRFSLSGIRTRIQDGRNLIEDGTTNCLHTALLIAEVMGFGPWSIGERFVKLLRMCYRRAVDMMMKFEEQAGLSGYIYLAVDLIDLHSYSAELSESTRNDIFKVIKDLLEEKKEIKDNPYVSSWMEENGLGVIQLD